MTVIPGFCFSNTDWVSGIICPVISGLDTTATVTVLELLLLLALPPELLLEIGGHRHQSGHRAHGPERAELERRGAHESTSTTIRTFWRGTWGEGYRRDPAYAPR